MSTPTEFASLALIRQGIDHRFKIKIRNLELYVRPLSMMEEDQITQEAIDEMKKLPEENQTSLRSSMLLSALKLERAQYSDVGKGDAKIFAAELQRFTVGEFDFLFKQYLAGCDKLNPVLEKMERKDVEKWVDELKKNSADLEMILIDSSFFQLVQLSRHLLTTGDSPEGK